VFCIGFSITQSETLRFDDVGGVPDDDSIETMQSNREQLTKSLNGLNSGDTFIIPEGVFHTIGGIMVDELINATVKINGELRFSDDRDTWPVDENGKVLECLNFRYVGNSIFTSDIKDYQDGKYGVINGNGRKWWGAINYLKNQENRPRLFRVGSTDNMIFEHILLKDSPFWSFWVTGVEGLIVRYSSVDARITDSDRHTALDLTAFNTDGFDVEGNNVHMHDLQIWNQDDCVAIKDGSSNMLIERVNASGLGFVIGSIGDSVVKNITFRHSTLYHSYKGIYMKTRWSDNGAAPLDEASVQDVTYENITMIEPEQYSIWIGPAQQSGQPCELYWPQGPRSECRMSGYQTWKNILLKDIFIYNPRHSPGVLISNDTNKMQNVRFENVVIKGDIGDEPFGENFYCQDYDDSLTASESTSPMPACASITTI
jgi:hypothetical protein